MAVYLESERLVLREFLRDEVSLLFDLDSDPEVMRYIKGGFALDPLDAYQAWMDRIQEHYRTGPDRGFWALAEKGGEPFIGWLHFYPSRLDPSDWEIGYRLKRTVWGRGYATEASRMLIDRALVVGKTPIVARTMIGNMASRRVLEKLGMTVDLEFEEDRFPGEDKRAVRFRLNLHDGNEL